ncbi:hypothetical protein UFOVP474_48 [uncultured Caudovirales phage]|uniref:Uncharacterized protein n=1 Tax=uncultured Caudovirales phage TaxID=2100421 RepID=A0A6J5MHW4_9CAUD|nr:hypothetical protein UFOVP474_48 [uncultured Caudovirales phage]CAB4190065.1 hypothetical protein UFOVP1207_44 [uncultured Caudovirales phage]
MDEDDDDTQVYKDDGNALLIAYQSGYYDGKKQRPWVDLTDDEIWTLHDSYPNPVEFARAIEQLSKEKNL